MTYRGAQEVLDEVLPRAFAHAGSQLAGPALHRGVVRRQRQLMGRLRDRHMRPLVTVARAQIEPDSDVRLPAAFRMPSARLGVTRLLQACDGMMEAAVPFEAALIAHGLPADFLVRFLEARDELERTRTRRAECTSSHIGARMGLAVELRRGRRAVDRLDAVVRAAFEDDEAVLTAWRSAKRVRRLPGARHAHETVDGTRESTPGPTLRMAA